MTTAKLFADNFATLSASPDGIAKLRELILQLAVQGKLVPQNEKDEPAEKLLEKIRAEKAKLIKEGKLKKQKLLPPITDDEIPYQLPNGWQWARLNDFNIFENGDRSKNYPSKSVLVDKGIPFINAGHLRNGVVDFSSMNYITDERYDLLRSGKVCQNDILFCLRGSLGKSAIVQTTDLGAIASSLVIIRKYGDIETYYMLNYLFSPLCSQMISQYDNGTAQPNLAATDLKKFLVPVPPLVEQKRIVAKVDQLMALCDRMEEQLIQTRATHRQLNDSAVHHLLTAESDKAFAKNWQLICDNFDLLYDSGENVDTLRQAILQLAVQGKLVPQNPKDEPADKLLKKIQAEKAKLIKEGKLKKQKPLPPINADEIPYELPNGWQWARLNDFNIFENGDRSKNYPSKSVLVDKGIPFINAGHLRNGLVDYSSMNFIPQERFDILRSGKTCHGDILFCLRGSLGKSAIVKSEGQGAIASSLVIIRNYGNVEPYYLLNYLFSSLCFQMISKYDNGTAQPNLSATDLKKFLIPIPPLAEQKRIVARVDKLMALCDQLQARIAAAGIESEKLTASTLHHLLAG